MCGGVHSGPQIAPRANCIARSASLNLNIVEYIEHMLKFKEERPHPRQHQSMLHKSQS